MSVNESSSRRCCRYSGPRVTLLVPPSGAENALWTVKTLPMSSADRLLPVDQAASTLKERPGAGRSLPTSQLIAASRVPAYVNPLDRPPLVLPSAWAVYDAVGVIPSFLSSLRNPATSFVSVSSTKSTVCPTHSTYNLCGLAGVGQRGSRADESGPVSARTGCSWAPACVTELKTRATRATTLIHRHPLPNARFSNVTVPPAPRSEYESAAISA